MSKISDRTEEKINEETDGGKISRTKKLENRELKPFQLAFLASSRKHRHLGLKSHFLQFSTTENSNMKKKTLRMDEF